MKGENFIRVIDDAVTEESCLKLIDSYHKLVDAGMCHTRVDEGFAPSKINDTSAWLSDLLLSNFGGIHTAQITAKVTESILGYIKEFETGMFGQPPEQGEPYPICEESSRIQMTKPSQGFHLWHCENSSLTVRNRILTWILYLNDIDEGGETEFIHLSERISPKTGRLVIFPAGFTHAHRGNPPLSDTKYIITGWWGITT